MATNKKNFSDANTDEVFKRMFASSVSEAKSSEETAPAATDAPAQVAEAPQQNTAPAVSATSVPAATQNTEADDSALARIGRKFYLTPDIATALDRRKYLDRSKDLSGHVRAALEAYLAEDLAVIRSGGI